MAIVLTAASSASAHSNCRYFWVVRHGLSSPGSIDELLERAVAAGANGLVVQVVGRGESYYDSEILPPADFSGFEDPLAYLIMKARPLGLEVHGWVNAFLVWSSPEEPVSSTHVYHEHPEWFTGHISGRSSRDFSPAEAEAAGLVGPALSPAYPAVRGFITDVICELAENYSLTGIHLDYIRYPNSSFGYSEGEKERYWNDTGLLPEESSEEWNSWRRRQVTATVETVRASLNSVAPEMLLSCAVMANPNSAVNEFFCQWQNWLDTGLIDLAFPMAYTSSRERALELAALTTAEHSNKVVYGIGVWNQSVDNALTGAERALDRDAAGVCVFSLNSLPAGGEEKLLEFWGRGTAPEHGVSPAMFNRVVVR
ncbi:hypothetical protein CSA37_00420 [Candidatus Fermentibacteria bacterium]|nr:MAG: hypothetical protein CSA37_00420 [Candidatus Fermentibacteria bacterium]